MFSPFEGAMAASAFENAGEAAVIAAEAASAAKWRRESLVNLSIVLRSCFEGDINVENGESV